ncbi:MAG: PqqD family peptide modification chaperone [Candidatus Binatia bacterium]
MKPRAKHNGLLSEQLDDELLVYDPDRSRGHCLNRTAALVWRHADGEHTVAELAAILRTELDPVADDNLVWHTLDRLNAVHLLEEPLPRSPADARASRRAFVRQVGLLGAISLLLPLITSVAAPAPAQTQSCGSGSSGNCSAALSLAEWFKTK